MSELKLVPDAEERMRALDPEQSFIIQAPAGSGKTGLLIQRYLKLLACVDAPEEVVAITFTRKAAAEMRERVLTALLAAKNSELTSNDPYEKLTSELAQVVLQRDHLLGWHITENPLRLRIQTIDSLCASFVRQMPVLSKFGAQLETIEAASELYLEAARATIEMVESDEAIAQDIERLLVHLDNDVARIETLLAEMLAQRDHWLRHLHGKTRDELQTVLQAIRRDAVENICGLFSDLLQNELLALLHYAAANLAASGENSPIIACGELESLQNDGEVAHWCGVATLLLKKDDSWRKQVNVKNGFPAGKTKLEKEIAKHWKVRALALIEVLQKNNKLCQAFIKIRNLPAQAYTDAQWEVLGAITELLPYAVGQLKVVFQLCGKVDFTEVAQGASRALGEPEMPTDLALALDYQMRHLLIDEFQDTSISQYKLIEKLVAGWEADDDRSLFVVGDPMQSIYRFREAEVGLFLRARNEGIGNVLLQPIVLCANFRSQSGVVDWVNHAFSQIMPIDEDVAAGAVSYAHSVATHLALPGEAVSVYPLFNKSHVAEANQIVEIICQTRQHHSAAKIAILVRNRGHLKEIIIKLKENGLRFRALDIEPLGHKPVVQDLLILTRALIHPADRLAWFALLRAPWCGLTLLDFHALVVAEGLEGKNNSRTVWEMINDQALLQGITVDGVARLLHLKKVLIRCIVNRHRQSLRATVEAAWMSLGGPCYFNSAEMEAGNHGLADVEDALIYFDYLENQEVAGEILELVMFEKGLARLYAMPDLDADDNLQIMTIHKAKGLEFDCVIVPGLGRSSRSSDKRLLKWMERPGKQGQGSGDVDLVLAPIQEAGADSDSIYTWLQQRDDDKASFEDQRLLYVAATRARQRLHLLGSVDLEVNKKDAQAFKPPPTKTLLNKLWPIVYHDYAEAANQLIASDDFAEAQATEVENVALIDQSLHRLISKWKLPAAPSSVIWRSPQQKNHIQEAVEFSWVSEIARHTGSVVHYWLQRIAEDKMVGWNEERIVALRNQFKQALIVNGMVGTWEGVDCAVERVTAALTCAVSDPRGQWLLGPQQSDYNEMRLTAVINNELINLIIDRTFCDENNIRWIVDYKTSSHEGAGIETFLDREQTRYSAQLNRYASIMQLTEKREIRLGLYFPLLGGWREWCFNTGHN